MSEILTTKIDWVEFVTYKDYLRLKEEKEKIENFIEISKTEWKKVVKSWKWFVRICWDMPDDPMVRLEDFQMIVREREKLKKEKQELEYLWDINEELKEENKKLRDRISELEKCNLNFQEQIDKLLNGKNKDDR